MEMAKVTSKGQITIPVSIRRRLGINEGDKLLFIDRPDGVVMVNPDMFPAGQDADYSESEVQTQIIEADIPTEATPDVGTVAKAAPPKQKAAAPAVTDEKTQERAVQRPPERPLERISEKPGTKVKGLDIDALLNEIRSIGSKI